MATVPQYRRQVQEAAVPVPRAQAQIADTQGLDRGLAQAGRAATEIYDNYRQEADTTAVIGADTGLSNWTNDAMFNQESGVYSKKGANALNVTQDTLSAYDKQVQETLSGLSNDTQRKRFQTISAQRRDSLNGTLNRYEYGEHQQYMNDVDKASIQASQNTAALNYSDPDAISQSHKKIEDVIRSQGQRNGMAPEVVDVMIQKNTSSMYSDVLRRQAAQDPYKAQAALKQYQGFLTADDLTQVGGSIEAKVDRLQQKAEMVQLRAEAKAERTLGKINAQISSGIPATDEMWKQWGSQVRGTQAQGEFNELVKQEVDTQKILRLPIDQQISEINSKTAKLQQEGGTIADAANLNRLSRAVDASAKMMADSPLDYFQQRLGGDVVPLDLNSKELGAVLTDRVSAIQGMQKKFGSTVAMKPLLPQEAKQISAQLGEMSPEQQSKLFATLHSAIGDDKAYAGAMQQIAPDSPIRALTGLLAGKQRSMITDTHWFKPDEVATSGDVAKTMALGESILNKSKTEKGSDGKGSSFPIPKQADFQLELNNQLGSVFAGQPQSYQLAAQAVKSYYTGAAAEKGDVSGVVDRSLLRTAIKASVGEVVDFNGSKTLAPWGMAGQDFHDMAKQKLVGTMKAQGMSDAEISTADALTLRQYKDGIYYVMQGQQFKYGSDGKPMMVNVNEDAK